MNFKIGLLCLAPLLGDLTVKQEKLFNITIHWTEIHFTSSQLLRQKEVTEFSLLCENPFEFTVANLLMLTLGSELKWRRNLEIL